METSLSPGCAVARLTTTTDTHVSDAPAVAWEYTGRDWRPLRWRIYDNSVHEPRARTLTGLTVIDLLDGRASPPVLVFALLQLVHAEN